MASTPSRPKAPRRLRRPSTLVLYWEDGKLVCENYLTHEKAQVSPEVVALLDRYTSPRNFERETVDDLYPILSLAQLGFLTDRKTAEERKLDRWWWGQTARQFLFSTKDAHNAAPKSRRVKHIGWLHRTAPTPPLFKTYPSRSAVALEKPAIDSAVSNAISRLQNCRSYRLGPISRADLAEMLYLAWGARGLNQTRYWGPLVDKTSYSGGNRHPVEVYPVIVSVKGLTPGVYHYNVRDHKIELLKVGNFARTVRRIGNEQEWIRGASVYFLMTAVFKRTMWKYRHDYSLRTIFCDVGHLSQTLYLAAQDRGLGACTTYALNHTLAEQLLNIDGIDESFLSLSMVGHPSH